MGKVHNSVLKEFRQQIKLTQKEKTLARNVFTIFVCTILLSSFFVPAFADVTFDDATNISNDEDKVSAEVKLAAAGDIVYVVWRNNSASLNTAEVLMRVSTTNGSPGSFGATVNLSDSTGKSKTPQINASGTKAYIVWGDDKGGTFDIYFRNSTNSGATLFAEKNLSGSGATSVDPQIAISATNVYVIWQEGTGTPDIFFSNSTDDGENFNPNTASNLSSDSEKSFDPQITASGNNVYVVWYNHTFSFSDPLDTIAFRASTDNALNFNPAKRVSDFFGPNPGPATATLPQIAASGSNVFVVWDQSTDIFFTNSTDSGANFNPNAPTNLSNSGTGSDNPQIAVSGNNVFVVWEEGGEIFLRASTNLGLSFGSKINLSSNTGTSTQPQIVSSGSDVHVIWQDNSAGNQDIFLRSSPDSGSTFCSFVNLASDDGTSSDPEIAASGSSVYAGWLNRTASTDDVRFRNGTATASCVVQFNATQYITTGGALVTINDPASNDNADSEDSISVTVTSDTDTDGITLSFGETGVNTGIFTGSVSFTEDGSSSSSTSTLKTAPSNTITTNNTSGGQIGSATIFPRTVAFNGSQYELSNIGKVTVTDQNSNLTSFVETISITISSPSDSISLDLVENGAKTGVFEKNHFILMTGNDLIPIGSTVTISQSDPSPGTGPTSSGGTFSDSIIDEISIRISSTTDVAGIVLNITESGDDTRDFSGKLSVTSAASVNGSSIQVTGGDILGILYKSETSNALITPNTNSSVGALQAAITNTITADYKSSTDTATVAVGGGGGGGGGGLVRPSLVLDIIASLASSGGGGAGAAPIVTLNNLRHSSFIDMPDEIEQVVINFDPFTPLEPFDVTAEQFETFDFPLSIDNDGYALSGHSNTIDTKTLYTGEATKIKTVFYMSLKLEHVAFYTNMREGDNLDDSDTFLRFWKSASTQFEIKDENGFFEYINLTLEENGIKKIATFDMKFLKPMEKSDIVLRMWDEKLHSTTILIFDAIEVVESENADLKNIEETESSSTDGSSEGLEIPEPGTTQPETSELRIEEPPIVVPDWIKTSAKWWNEDQISDTAFARGIEYLIENNILKVPQTETFEQEQVQEIPSWLKSNAGWWGDGLLPDQDFVNGIQWLIKNGIMKIQINS